MFCLHLGMRKCCYCLDSKTPECSFLVAGVEISINNVDPTAHSAANDILLITLASLKQIAILIVYILACPYALLSRRIRSGTDPI